MNWIKAQKIDFSLNTQNYCVLSFIDFVYIGQWMLKLKLKYIWVCILTSLLIQSNRWAHPVLCGLCCADTDLYVLYVIWKLFKQDVIKWVLNCLNHCFQSNTRFTSNCICFSNITQKVLHDLHKLFAYWILFKNCIKIILFTKLREREWKRVREGGREC